LAAGLSARTVQYLRAVLRRALGQALKLNLVARNVATLVDPPRYQRPKVKLLSPDDIRVFLNSLKGNRLEALFVVTVALGLREGEVLGLRWQDLDLTAGVLRVSFALQRIDGKLQLVEPKTGRSRRTLSMPGVVCAALRDHRVRQLEDWMLAGERWRESGLVFTTSKGTPLGARNVIRKFHALLKKAGFPRHRFHDLRHSCASLLLAQHVPARVVIDVLGTARSASRSTPTRM
jgi:integrase